MDERADPSAKAVMPRRPLGLARVSASLASGAGIGLAIRVLAAGIGYGTQVALARLLGADDYGLFALAWTWIAVGGFAGCLGYSQMAVRFLPTYAETGQGALSGAFLADSRRIALGFGALLGLAGLAVALMRGPVGADPWLVVLAALCVPVFAYQDLLEGYGRALGRLGLALAPPYILRQAALLGLLTGAIAFGAARSATMAIAAALAATLIATLVQHVLTRRALAAAAPPGAADQPEAVTLGKARALWRRGALGSFLADGAAMLRSSADVLLVGLLVEPAMLAVYFAATRVAGLLGFVEYAVGAMAAHRFARLNAREDLAALRQAVRSALMTTFWPTIAAAAALSFLAEPILRLFGEGFAAGAPLVVILALGHVVRASVGPADDLLVMLGRERLALAAQAAGLAVNAALILALVPAHGLIAAAIAATAASAATTALLAAGILRAIGRAVPAGSTP